MPKPKGLQARTKESAAMRKKRESFINRILDKQDTVNRVMKNVQLSRERRLGIFKPERIENNAHLNDRVIKKLVELNSRIQQAPPLRENLRERKIEGREWMALMTSPHRAKDRTMKKNEYLWLAKRALPKKEFQKLKKELNEIHPPKKTVKK